MCAGISSTVISTLGVVLVPLSECVTPAASPPTESPRTPTSTLTPETSFIPSARIEELGSEWDLVMWQLGPAFASQIEDDVGVEVVFHDATFGGLSAGALLQELQSGESSDTRMQRLPDTLRDAEIVVMFVNPMESIDPEHPHDFEGYFHFRAPGPCSPESLGKYTADVEALWAKILELRAGQPIILRATDIYNPLVSPWTKFEILEACTECTELLRIFGRRGVPERELIYRTFSGGRLQPEQKRHA